MAIRENAIKGIQTGKEVNLPVFADGAVLYIENPKDATGNLPQFINEFSKAAWYKVNTQKSDAFLYTNNKKAEGEIKETIPATITLKRIKYLHINRHEGAKHLKTMTHRRKKLKMTQKDGEIYHLLGLEESILPKWLCYPRQSTNSVQSL